MKNPAIDHLLEREAARGQALLARDLDTLSSLLADELLHVHSNGIVHDKAAYLGHVCGPLTLLAIERRNLKVTMFGGAALMTGHMSSVMQPPGPAAPVTVDTCVVQVWIEGAGGWQLAVFQATRLPMT